MQRSGVKAPCYTTLSLSAEDGGNTVVYGPELKALYWVETTTAHTDGSDLYEHGGHISQVPTAEMMMAETHVYRSDEDGRRELFASFVFNPHHRPLNYVDTITFSGSETYDVDDFFRRKEFPSTSRLVTMPAGEFKWSSSSGIPKLYDSNRRLIARHRHRTKHLFFPSSSPPDCDSKWRPPTIEVAHSAMWLLDLVILGWVVTMHDIWTPVSKSVAQ